MSTPLPQYRQPQNLNKSSEGLWSLQPPHPGGKRATQGLYIHIPFCFHKCHYCDFYSLVETASDRQEAFTDRLIAELSLRARQVDLRPSTLFVGGGTPTLLRPELWRRLLAALRDVGVLETVSEFTVEANPETVTAELVELLLAGGVNRVSLGAQSFHPDLLKMLERWHEPASVARAVETLRCAGLTNFNLDLIFAIPGQSLELLRADLDAALALGPAHLSCYGLTYEPNTAMTQRLKMGKVTPAEEELERQMYALVMDQLDAAGFEHYEVSNWARRAPGQSRPPSPRRCSHNLIYWTNRNWLGLGPAAASHMDGRRWKNEPHLGRYLDQNPEPPTTEHEELPPARRVGEEIMLRLRLREGAEHAWLENNLAADDPRRATMTELVAMGMLERTNSHLRLTRRGLFVADAVIGKLL